MREPLSPVESLATMSVPSFELLESLVGHQFLIKDAASHSTMLHLDVVDRGVPMNKNYTCYSALFSLPANVHADSAFYHVQYPAEGNNYQVWALLLTPVAPSAEGRQRLEALFHYPLNSPST